MIGIDAMGGDFAPLAIVEGALLAAKKGVAVCLYGDQHKILDLLNRFDTSWKNLSLTLVHCPEVISMDDEPTKAITTKKDASLVLALKALHDKQITSFISAGNSGACLVASMIHVGRLAGIQRPAIGGFLPTRDDYTFCIDLGANIDCKPAYLRQFAMMGQAYVQVVRGIKEVKVGLLANGSESSKGSKLIQETHQLLKETPINFVGNCEPSDIFNGFADVIVCEGFSGNIMLKTVESTVSVLTQWIRESCARSWFGRCAGFLAFPVLKRLKKNLKRTNRGGALLLGVKQPVIIAHGASKAEEICNALLFAQEVVDENLYERFNSSLQRSLAMLEGKTVDVLSPGEFNKNSISPYM